MPCPKTPFPRAALPPDFGENVRKARKVRHWTQQRLADKVGIRRETIARLEGGRTVPSPQLVRALLRNDVLGRDIPFFKGGEFDDPDRWQRGPRARAARLASGQTLGAVAAKAGGSIASLSSFEWGLLAPVAFAGDACDDDCNTVSEDFAQALGFFDANEMRNYLKSDDPLSWLEKIAGRYERKLPPAALLPTRRVPVIDDTTELPAFLLD